MSVRKQTILRLTLKYKTHNINSLVVHTKNIKTRLTQDVCLPIYSNQNTISSLSIYIYALLGELALLESVVNVRPRKYHCISMVLTGNCRLTLLEGRKPVRRRWLSNGLFLFLGLRIVRERVRRLPLYSIEQFNERFFPIELCSYSYSYYLCHRLFRWQRLQQQQGTYFFDQFRATDDAGPSNCLLPFVTQA